MFGQKRFGQRKFDFQLNRNEVPAKGKVQAKRAKGAKGLNVVQIKT